MDEAAVGRSLHEQGWRTVFTVDQMMAAWEQFIATVELGYDDSIHEYLNDLSCRDWLHEAWQLLSDDKTTAWNTRLARLDERFRRATVDVDQPLMDGPPGRWWLLRCPRLPTGEPATDLGGDQPAR